MKVSIESTCWETRIDGFEKKFDFADCFLLTTLHQPCLDLDGITYVKAEDIIEAARVKFPGVGNIDEAIDRARDVLEGEDLVKVKARASGVIHVALTNAGLNVAARLQRHIERFIPLVTVCQLNHDNQILSGVEWEGAEKSQASE